MAGQSRNIIIKHFQTAIESVGGWAEVVVERYDWQKCSRYPSAYLFSTDYPDISNAGRNRRLTLMVSIIVIAPATARTQIANDEQSDDMVERLMDEIDSNYELQKSLIKCDLQRMVAAPHGNPSEGVKAMELLYQVVYERQRMIPTKA